MSVTEMIGDANPIASQGEALHSADDDVALVEMANLYAEKTGVDGVIYISTPQGSHAARIRRYPGRPKDGAPCLSATVAAAPEAFNHRLPQRVFDAAATPVKAWSVLNHVALRDFWGNGTSWMDEEVDAPKKALKRLP